MDPVSLALMGGGGLLNYFAGRAKDRAAQARQRNIMRLSSPEHLAQIHNMLYQKFLNSPAFSQGQRGIFNSTATTGNNLASSLAARGLSTSGVGAIAPALASSAGAGQLGALRTGGYNAAGQQAESQIGNEITAASGEPTNYAGEALGGSLSDLAGMLVNPSTGKAKKSRSKKMPVYTPAGGGAPYGNDSPAGY